MSRHLHAPSPLPLPAEIRALIERIPQFQGSAPISIEPLASVISLNNSNYRLTVGDHSYLLRVAADTAHFLGIERKEELEAAQAAAGVGLAPRILYSEPTGHMLMPWIEGRHWEPEEFHIPEKIHRLGDTLRRLHRVTEVKGDASVFRRIERLLQNAESLKLKTPDHLQECLTRMAEIEARRHAAPNFAPGLTHNDFWANNFIDDGEKLWIVDWEFSGNGDGFYDLATTAFAGNYSEEEHILLLEAYGCDHLSDLKTLESMKFIVLLFEACWALVMDGLRGSDHFDYKKQSVRMFHRLAEHL